MLIITPTQVILTWNEYRFSQQNTINQWLLLTHTLLFRLKSFSVEQYLLSKSSKIGLNGEWHRLELPCFWPAQKHSWQHPSICWLLSWQHGHSE